MAHLDITKSNTVFDVLQEWEDVLESSQASLDHGTSLSSSLEWRNKHDHDSDFEPEI